MPFNYPLIIPGAIGPSKANLKKFDAVAEETSPFDGSAQQQQWQDQHWELDLSWPELTWAQFAALDAFSGALHGKMGSFLWGPPLATGPRGIALVAGTPTIGPAVAPMPGSLTSITASPPVSSPFPAGSYYVVLVMQDTFGQIFQSSEIGPIVLDGTRGFLVSWSVLPPNAANYWLYYGTAPGMENASRSVLAVSMGFNTILDYRGIAAGTVPPPGRNQSGQNLISTQGWLPNQNGVLLPGDFFQLTAFDTNAISRQRLYQNVSPNPINTDGGGNAVIDTFPCVRETLPQGTGLVLLNPAGTFRLAENRRESPADRNKTFSFQMKCREAI